MPEHSSLECLRGEKGKENVPPSVLSKEKVECSPSASPRKVSFAQKREGGNPLTQRKRRLQTVLAAGKFGGPSRVSRNETIRVREDDEESVRLPEHDLNKHVHGDEDDNTQGSVNTVLAAMAFANSSPDDGIHKSTQASSLKGLLVDDEVADKPNQRSHASASPGESVRSTMRATRRIRQAPSPTLSASSRRRQGLNSVIAVSLSDSPASASTTLSSTSGVSLFPSSGSVSSGNSQGSLKSRLSSRSSTTSSPLPSFNNTVIPNNLKSLLPSSTPLSHSRSTTTSPASSTIASTVATSSMSLTPLPSSSASVIERTSGSLRSRLQALNATPSTASFLSASVSPPAPTLEALTDHPPSSASALSDHSPHSCTTAPTPSLQSSSSCFSCSSSSSSSSHVTPAATSLRALRPSSSSTSVASGPSSVSTPASSSIRLRSSSIPTSASSAAAAVVATTTTITSTPASPPPLASTSTLPASSTQPLYAVSHSNNTNNNTSTHTHSLTSSSTVNSASLPSLTTLPSISSLSLNSAALPQRPSSSSSSSSSTALPQSSLSSQPALNPSHSSFSSSAHPASSQAPPVSHHSSNASTSSKNRKEKEEVHYVNGKQYFVLELIGQGGSSKVYRVLSKDKKVFALKRISLGGDVNHAADYHNEIALLQRLKGRPYVIQLIDAQEDLVAGVIYMVFELGTMDLAHYLQANQNSKTWDNNSIRYFWKQMLECTQMCHDEKILHLDLKPPNFVLVDGSLKLIDFGIAKEVQADMTHIMNENNVGTLDYMSPESVVEYKTADLSSSTQAHKLGRSSDVWSLGCILYQMVYKTPPFKKLSLGQKMAALMDPKLVVKFGPCEDPALLQVMKACLQYNPKNRPTISQLLAHPYLMPKHDVVSKHHLQLILQQLGVPNYVDMTSGILAQIQAGQAVNLSKFTATSGQSHDVA